MPGSTRSASCPRGPVPRRASGQAPGPSCPPCAPQHAPRQSERRPPFWMSRCAVGGAGGVLRGEGGASGPWGVSEGQPWVGAGSSQPQLSSCQPRSGSRGVWSEAEVCVNWPVLRSILEPPQEWRALRCRGGGWSEGFKFSLFVLGDISEHLPCVN